jgi:hypothetical protein
VGPGDLSRRLSDGDPGFADPVRLVVASGWVGVLDVEPELGAGFAGLADLRIGDAGVVTDAPDEAVDEYEAGCRRSDESAGARRSTSRPRQPTHRE